MFTRGYIPIIPPCDIPIKKINTAHSLWALPSPTMRWTGTYPHDLGKLHITLIIYIYYIYIILYMIYVYIYIYLYIYIFIYLFIASNFTNDSLIHLSECSKLFLVEVSYLRKHTKENRKAMHFLLIQIAHIRLQESGSIVAD